MAWPETARAKYRRPSRRFESDLTDAERARPAPSRTGRPRRVELREVVNALLYQLMTGCQCRALTAGLADTEQRQCRPAPIRRNQQLLSHEWRPRVLDLPMVDTGQARDKIAKVGSRPAPSFPAVIRGMRRRRGRRFAALRGGRWPGVAATSHRPVPSCPRESSPGWPFRGVQFDHARRPFFSLRWPHMRPRRPGHGRGPSKTRRRK